MYLCTRLGKETPGIAAALKRIFSFYSIYELDNIDCRRTLRSRFYLLSRPRQGCHRNGVVGMDGRFSRFHSCQYGASRPCHPHAAAGHGISRLDRHRRCRHGARGHIHLRRARHILAHVFHHHADSICCGAEDDFVNLFPVRLKPSAVCHDRLHVLQRPVGELADYGYERMARWRKLVLHTDGNLGEHRAPDQSVGFERMERTGEHLRGYVGNELAELVEARAAVLAQDEDDEQSPLVAEACHDVPDGAYLND